jgi:pentatricopeptide repeat protein
VKRELTNLRTLLMSTDEIMRDRKLSLSKGVMQPSITDSFTALKHSEGGTGHVPSRISPSPIPLHAPILALVLQATAQEDEEAGVEGGGKPRQRLALSRLVSEVVSRLNIINGIGNSDLLSILKHQSGASATGSEITGSTSITDLFPLLTGKRAAAAFVGADSSVYAVMLGALGTLGVSQLGPKILDFMKLTERESMRRQNLLQEVAASLNLRVQAAGAGQVAQLAAAVPGSADSLDESAFLDSVLTAAGAPRVDSASAVSGTVPATRRLVQPLPVVQINEAVYAAMANSLAGDTSQDVNTVHQVVALAKQQLKTGAVAGSGVAFAAALIKAHGVRGNVDAARRLYHEALAQQHAMQDNALGSSHEGEASDWLVTGGGLPLLHCAFLDVLGREGHLVEARTVALSLMRPHDYVKSIAADAAADEGESTSPHAPTPPLRAAVATILKAEAAATAAMDNGTEPDASNVGVSLACMDVRTMTALARAYAGAGQATGVSHVADVIAQAGLTPSVDTYGVVLSALSANKRNGDALAAAELLAAGSGVDAGTAGAVDISALLSKEGIPSASPAENMGAAVSKQMTGTRFGPLAKAALAAVKDSANTSAKSASGVSGQPADGGNNDSALDVPFSLTPNATPALAAVLQGRFSRFPGESARCQGAVGCLMTHVYIKAGLLPQARLVLAGVERGVAVRRKDIQGAYDALVAAFASEGASAAVDEALAAMEDSSQMSGEAEHSAAPVTHGGAVRAPAGGDVHAMVGDVAASQHGGRDDANADEAEGDTAAGQSKRRGRLGLKKLFRAAANAVIVEQTYKKLMSSYGLQGKVGRARAMFEGVQRARGTRTMGRAVADATKENDSATAKATVGKALDKWAETAARANLDGSSPGNRALADTGLSHVLASMGDEAGNDETLQAAASGLATVIEEGCPPPKRGAASPPPMFTSDEKADSVAVHKTGISGSQGSTEDDEDSEEEGAEASGGMDGLVLACAPNTMAVTADCMTSGGFATQFEESAAKMGDSSIAQEEEAEVAAGDEAAEADADVATAMGSLGAEAYNVLIDAYGEGCRLDMAVATLSEMLQEGTLPNAGTLIALINGFSLSGRGAEVLGVMDQVVEVLATRSSLSGPSITRLIMDAGVVAARLAALGSAGRPDLVHAAWLAYCEFRLVTVAARAGASPEATMLRAGAGGNDNVQRLLPVFIQYSDRPTAVAPDVHRALAESYLSAQAMALSRCGSNAYYATTCVRSAAGMVQGLSAAEAAAVGGKDRLRTALSTLPVPAQLDECVALMQDTVSALAQLGHPTSITSLTSVALAYRMAGMADEGRALLVKAVAQIAQATSRSSSAVRHQQVPVDAPTSAVGWGYGMDSVYVDEDADAATGRVGAKLADTARVVPPLGTAVPDDVRMDPEMLSALISTLGANGMTGEIRAVLESVARAAGVVDTARAVRSVRSAVGLQAAVEANADWEGGLSSSVTDMWNDLTDDLRHMLYAAFGMRRDVATADRLWRAGGYSARV